MAIIDETQSTAQPQTPGQAYQQPQFQAGAQTTQPDQGQQTQAKWSFHNPGSFGRAPLSRGVGSEALQAIKEALIEELKSAEQTYEMSVITVDRAAETKLDFSALVICLRDKSALTEGVGYHTLLIEGSGEELNTNTENVNGRQVEVFHPTSDACDSVVNNIVMQKIKAAFPGIPAFMADFCVVPRSFNPKDKNAIHNLTVNAGLAAMTEVSIHKRGFLDMNWASSAKDSSLKADLIITSEQIEDCVGNPIRSDVRVNLSSKLNTNTQGGAQNTINTGDMVTKISTLGGFVDLVFSPVSPQANTYNAYAPQIPTATQKYLPRFVITNFESMFLSTHSAQLLSILTSFAVRNDNNWIQAFRQIPQAGGKIDMHDIGGVGYEMNFEGNQTGFGKRVNTSADAFRPENLGQLVSAAISPDLVISLDVPEAGAQSWYTGLFSAASTGMDQRAINAVISAANQLTNGAFVNNFKPGSSIFVGQPERVHLGYYIDENGAKRDLRDIDYLAVCNLCGEREPSVITLWSNTFTRLDIDIRIRLADRKRIISSLKPSAVFTGFANRVTFTREFMDALVISCNAVGVAMSISTPMNTGDFNNERGVASFLQGARLSNNVAGVFNRGYSQGAAVPGMNFNTFGRW